MSRRIPMYSRIRASGLANGWPYQPSTTCGPETPSPSTIRPPERWWRDIASIAVAAGVRAEICAIAVPSLIVVVAAPHQASGVSTSEPYASAVHTESNPRRSASRTVSWAPGGRSPPPVSEHQPELQVVRHGADTLPAAAEEALPPRWRQRAGRPATVTLGA